MGVYNQSRKNVLLIIFFVLFGILAVRLFYIQVIDTKYRKLAAMQAIKKETIYPARGLILDRNGKVLVNNQAMYDLMVIPDKVQNMDTSYFCQLLDIDTTYFKKRIRRAVNRNGPVRPTIFMPMLTDEMYGRIQENIYMFPGFELVKRPARRYPYACGAHIFGYIHEVDSAMIKNSGYFYQAGDLAGVTGLERTYEAVLRGQRGVKYVVRDVYNRVVGSYANGQLDTAAIAGKDIRLALDVQLEMLGKKLLKNKIGSIVALDPKTGGILAMVSSPDYPPDLLSGADLGNNYMRLLRNPSKPLFNRAIQAAYPPGSTFKPIDALVALDEKVITPDFGIPCTGGYYGCGRVLHCTEHWAGHSRDLETAITWSCNSYFFDIFRKIIAHKGNPAQGLVDWNNYMHAFGLGQKLGVDLPGESAGNIPDTAYYDRFFGAGRWSSCTIVSCGIGQGEVLETPLQMANALSIIANKGYYYTPHLVNSIDSNSQVLEPFHKKHVVTHIPDDYYNTVIAGMRGVVTAGTGRYSAIPGIAMCGKTGTAQNPHGKDHSLFTAFAPMEDPKIVVAVIVENAGYGATYAAPIASLMIEKYLNDTIATGKRTAIMEKMEQTTILPKEVLQYRHQLDSLQKAKAAEQARTALKKGPARSQTYARN